MSHHLFLTKSHLSLLLGDTVLGYDVENSMIDDTLLSSLSIAPPDVILGTHHRLTPSLYHQYLYITIVIITSEKDLS